ncbi:MAG: UDP-N-acetylmuramoyl-tripeptide--D-alanyl-D-alanine ligase, partial [Actinomycetota bacterium]
MIPLSTNEIASIMGGTLYGSADLTSTSEFQFDSRLVKKGDVFLALQGEKVDGHDFVDDARSRGAVLTISTKQVSGAYIMVDDVLKSIGKLASFVRNTLTELKVIGITGSQGKTTTKDMVYSILANEGETVAAHGSFNNDLGVPLTLLRCTEKTKFCVVEMGARHGGDIAALTRIAQPDIGVVLKVGNAHIGEFGSQEK